MAEPTYPDSDPIRENIEISKNNEILSYPVWCLDWRVVFDFSLHSLPNQTSSFLKISGHDEIDIDEKFDILNVEILPQGSFKIRHFIDSKWTTEFSRAKSEFISETVDLDRKNTLEIRQIINWSERFNYRIILNGRLVHHQIFQTAKKFNFAKIWAGDDSDSFADAEINALWVSPMENSGAV